MQIGGKSIFEYVKTPYCIQYCVTEHSVTREDLQHITDMSWSYPCDISKMYFFFMYRGLSGLTAWLRQYKFRVYGGMENRFFRVLSRHESKCKTTYLACIL